MISTFSCFLRSIYWWYSSPFSSTNNCISGFATKTKILSEMALTIKSSALTGRIVPFFISSCSDRSSRLIANRKLGNKVLRQISFPHSLVRISLYINKGSSGLAVLFNRIVSKRKCIRNHWKQQTDEIKNVLSVLMKCFFQGKLISFLRQVKAFLSVVFYLHRLWS